MSEIHIQFNAEQQQKANEIADKLEVLRKVDRGELLFTTEEKNHLTDDVLSNWITEAEQLGLGKIQAEMQNLCVKISYPEDYAEIKGLLIESEAMCEIVFKTFALPLRAMLDELGIEYTFEYRMKSVYSIWRKMRVDHKNFDDVYDLFATRIVYKPEEKIKPLMQDNTLDIIPEVRDIKEQYLKEIDTEKFYCWRIYTIISSLYRIHPDRIKNWITNPKPSGYQALQLTVMGPDCNWIEIQVRSERMHYEAEMGVAAHWKYKQEKSVK